MKTINTTEEDHNFENIELILGNSNKRFSGVTSTMLHVLDQQKHLMNTAVLGKHFVPDDIPTLTFRQTIKLCRTPLKNGKHRIFHARRNDEMIQALIIKKIFGGKIKIVFTSTAQRYHSRFTRRLIDNMDGIVSTCQAAAHYLIRKPDIISPHGIDPKIYAPAPDKDKLWAQLELPGKYGIGIFGRVRKQKGVDILVDAAIPLLRQYPDFSVVIVGEITPDNEDFVKEQRLKIKRAKLNGRFLFTGKQKASQIPKLFRSMSIIAALSRNEGFGLTVLEAMSCGIPVIASTAGAWTEIIEDGVDGYLTPCGDLEAVKAKLERLLNQEQERQLMGLLGRKKIERKYTIEKEAKTLCDYFKSLQ